MNLRAAPLILLMASTGLKAEIALAAATLSLAPATCQVGADCPVSVQLKEFDPTVTVSNRGIAAVAATLQGSNVSCSACSSSDKGSNGGCQLNPTNCRFVLADLADPIESFGVGEILTVNVACATKGSHSVSFADIQGSDIDGSPVSIVGDGSSVIECGPASCGDGILDLGESCDDGDTTQTTCDPCGAECQNEICGDANGNGTITSTDALQVLKVAVGQVPNAVDKSKSRCNPTGDADGTVTSSDALRVLRKAVGQNPIMACID